MRKLVAGFMAAVALAFTPSLRAEPAPRLDHGAMLNHSQCPAGRLVVNITETILNDIDSGVGGSWALDDIVRHIQVVQVAANTFCATVKYDGLFTTLAGTSPGGTGTVGDGIRGTLQGGYISTIFTGTLKSGVQTRGNVGTIDYDCDATGNCPGAVDWTEQLFDNVGGFDLAWWGWIYHAGNNGTWVNADNGNSGDITGS